MAAQKDTIYIDVEDDITAIVDKIRGSKEKIIALVLPKHAPVLQSSVNMKLVKRAAEVTKKNIVLITAESSVLSVAGATNVYVAKTLQSKPYIPSDSAKIPQEENITPGSAPVVDDSKLDLKKPVGEYMKLRGAQTDEEQTSQPKSSAPLAVNNYSDEDDDEGSETIEAPVKDEIVDEKSTKKVTHEKRFKVPDFDIFRLKFIIGFFVIVVLGVGWYVGFNVMPKATVTLLTENTAKSVSEEIVASANATKADKNILPAKMKEMKETVQEVITAPSGTKDLGTKATGSVIITNCTDNDVTIPIGTGISSGDLTFLVNKTVVVPASNFYSGGDCKNDGVLTVNVTASQGGEKYNVDAKTYTVAGVSTKITAQGTAMTGGTTKVVKTVSDKDIETVKQKLLDKLNKNGKKDSADAIAVEGYFPLLETYTEVQSDVKSVPAVGEEATGSATVTIEVMHTIYGIKEDALKTYIAGKVASKYDSNTQQISDDGLSKASIRTTDSKDPKNLRMNLETTVKIGPKLDGESIKNQIVGKKSGEVRDKLGSIAGVKEVNVEYSPFWVSTAPKNKSKITVIIKDIEDSQKK